MNKVRAESKLEGALAQHRCCKDVGGAGGREIGVRIGIRSQVCENTGAGETVGDGSKLLRWGRL